MANRFLGEADVTVDGKSYKLRFDFNTMCWFTDRTGKDAIKAMAGAESGDLDLRDMRVLMQCCLLHHSPDATLQEAGNVLSQDFGALLRVIQAAMPENGELGARPDAGNLEPGTAA
ncbi:hypothetical protein GYB14_16655 [bacterium]|nr:hypothetical protein [bacterium]